jgi:subtilisin family serine protease
VIPSRRNYNINKESPGACHPGKTKKRTQKMKNRQIIKRGVIAASILTIGLAAMRPTPAQAEQYLIVAKGSSFTDAFDRAVKNAGGKVNRKLAAIGVAVARSDDPGFLAKAAAIPEVQSVVPDLALPIQRDAVADTGAPSSGSPWGSPPPDLTSFQWAQKAIHADDARGLGVTGRGVRIVVMDGSIMTQHPGLVNNLNVALSKSFVPDEGVEFDPTTALTHFSHATHVAGIIAANLVNGGGTIGVAPQAELVLAKVGHDADETIQPSAAIAALMYAADIHADVVNMSWGVYVWKTQASWLPSYPPEWQSAAIRTACSRAADYAYEHGVTLVAAAGNQALDFDHYRSLIFISRDLPHVISVSATGPVGWARNPATDLDLPALYTDYGQSAIDLAAPGGNPAADSDLATVGGITLPCFVFDMVLSTSSRFAAQFGDQPEDPYEPNGTWTWACGTSMAAPHLVGVAALVIEANGGPGAMTPDQVRTILQRSADDLGKPGNDDFYGLGRVNALRAVLQQ